MADRVVKVSLLAQVTQYLDGMDKAARKTRDAASEAERLAKQSQAFTALGRASFIAGGVIAAGLGVAIAKFAQFDQAMSQVNAVTQETTENMDKLRAAALEAGGRTIYTATEAANAIEELGKAGISTADILNGALDGALDLAASGQLEVARAAEITATTLKQFGLEGSDAARVADTLSAGAGKALGSVEDLAQGLKFVGPVAGAMGISLEDTTATLALFADQGIIGEQAGSALRGMLASLQAPSKAAAAKLDELGISLYDANGGFVGMGPVIDQLNGKLGNVDDQTRDTALGLIFTNAQLTTAQTLVGDAGARWDEYRAAVEESGYASRVAADRLDNLAGDVEKLGGAFDTALIQTGSSANDSLRGLVQTTTFLVDGFSELPEPVLNVGFALGAVAAAAGLVGGTALTQIPKLNEFKLALNALNLTGRTAAIGIGATTAALTAAVLVLGAIATDAAERRQAIDSFEDSLDQVTGKVTDYSRELIAARLQEEGAIDVGKRLGLSMQDLVDLTLEGKGAITEWADARRAANAEDAAVVTQYDTVSGALEVVSGQLAKGKKQWELNQEATEGSREATAANERALSSMRGEAADTGDEIESLADIIRSFGMVTLDSREAERQFQAALDEVTASLNDNGSTLDTNTEAGRENEATLDDLAKASLERAAAIYDETSSQEDATVAIQAGRDALIQQLAQFGIVGPEAEAYADKLGLIPANVGTIVEFNADQATKDLERWVQTASGRLAGFQVGGPASIYSARGYAAGGYTGNIPRNAIAGAVHGQEFVSDARTVANPSNRAALEYMHNGGDIRYMSVPQPVVVQIQGGDSDMRREQNFTLNANGVDPVTVVELLKQQLAAKLAVL
jgi:TP901 family phage tail tape measure protein